MVLYNENINYSLSAAMRFVKFLFIFLLMNHSGLVQAYEPFFTEDAGTLPVGKYQIDLFFYNILEVSDPSPQSSSLALDPEDQIFFGNDRSLAFPITISKGLTERLEASLGIVYYQQPNGTYLPFANWQLGAK
jgi:hypothetical protein